MRGRKPDSPALKLIKGSRGAAAAARVDAENLPLRPISEAPEPPQHLNADGVKLWHEVIGRLMESGQLDRGYLFPIEQLCYAWQRSRHKMKAGLEVTAAENRELTRMFTEFGMTKGGARQQESGGEVKRSNKWASLKNGASQGD